MDKTIPSRSELESRYIAGKSMWELSQELHCSVHKVAYWMSKYGIKRRSWSEATYIKSNPNGDPFLIKEIHTPAEDVLYGLGIGIYWGEGEKVSRHAVKVANTDIRLLESFIKFLTQICGVKNEKLHYSIVCFNDSNPDEVVEYWSKQLKTNRAKFGKIVQIPPQGKGVYRRKSQYGVCTVTVCNIKLKKWLLDQIGKLS